MAPFAKTTEGIPRHQCLLLVRRDDLDLGLGEQEIQVTHTIRTMACFDDYRGLEERRRRYETGLGLLDGLSESMSLWLRLQDSDDCRCVDDHAVYAGSPVSL